MPQALGEQEGAEALLAEVLKLENWRTVFLLPHLGHLGAGGVLVRARNSKRVWHLSQMYS